MESLDFESFLEVLSELFSHEVSLAISDTEHYLYFRPSRRIDLKLKAGDPVKAGTITHQALNSGKKVSDVINRDVLGVPYKGQAIPFYKNEMLQGCVTAIYPAAILGKSVITIKKNDGWIPVPFPQVIYMEAKNRRTYVFSERGNGTHKDSLQEFEFSLPIDTFIRCHRSFIVNVHQIQEIYPDSHSTFILSMSNGDKIPVSQSYSSYFRKLLSF
ncbi:LytTR family DNA-binding domain-containing protein [Bacillus testis]|uniref:LytTR family DNA-binding domain-containing protein n=1 Tax=Bacillus testis TaxID=1622072 RepID=UPI00067F566F|nr:LytTR family DNA-binding domain-containing protein [Bacillus testis]